MSCWDPNDTLVSCAGTGQDGEIQAGAPLLYTDNLDGTITDDNTGLMWEKKSDDGTIHDMDTQYTWADAFAVHVVGLNTASFAGHSDWRLPNMKELQGIVDYGKPDPSVDVAFNTDCASTCTVTACSCTKSNGNYWTSGTLGTFPANAWYVNFSIGFVSNVIKSNTSFARAVRGP